MNKHTPGPWQLARFNANRATVEVETVARGDELPDQGYFIALVGSYAAEPGPDARLIAAAPDLLAALEAVAARISGEWDNPALVAFGPLSVDTEADCSAIARSAIAKARGEC